MREICLEGELYIHEEDHLAVLAEKDRTIEGIVRDRDNLLNCSARETEKIAALRVTLQESCQILAEGIKVVEGLEAKITALQEREKVLIQRLQSHGDVETDKEEALRGEEVKDVK